MKLNRTFTIAAAVLATASAGFLATAGSLGDELLVADAGVNTDSCVAVVHEKGIVGFYDFNARTVDTSTGLHVRFSQLASGNADFTQKLYDSRLSGAKCPKPFPKPAGA